MTTRTAQPDDARRGWTRLGTSVLLDDGYRIIGDNLLYQWRPIGHLLSIKDAPAMIEAHKLERAAAILRGEA